MNVRTYLDDGCITDKRVINGVEPAIFRTTIR
jgi:hypothetical protein